MSPTDAEAMAGKPIWLLASVPDSLERDTFFNETVRPLASKVPPLVRMAAGSISLPVGSINQLHECDQRVQLGSVIRYLSAVSLTKPLASNARQTRRPAGGPHFGI
jgi:hypothetical protein